jgi:hypothetical protein
MADELEKMLQQMDGQFDLSFDSLAEPHEQLEVEEGAGERPKINPEYSSPENSTNEEFLKDEGTRPEILPEDEPSQNGKSEAIGSGKCNDRIETIKDGRKDSYDGDLELEEKDGDVMELWGSHKRAVSPDKPIDLAGDYEEHEDDEEEVTYRSLSDKLEFALRRLKKSPTSTSDFSTRQ